jgi:hypothetical protein
MDKLPEAAQRRQALRPQAGLWQRMQADTSPLMMAFSDEVFCGCIADGGRYSGKDDVLMAPISC